MNALFSIVVPVYQNRANLGHTIPRLLALVRDLTPYRVELVLVDDGSTDGSRDALREFAAQHPDVIRVVLLSRNFGQTPAVQAGLRHARGHCVGIISCDLQEPCEQFQAMLALWERGHKFVIGERVQRNEGAGHRLTSSIYWRIVRRYAFPEFPSMGYDFCLLDRQVVDEINRINEKNSSIFVLIYWLGYTPARVPIVRELRQEGRSQWNLSRKISFTLDTLIGFTRYPARLISLIGMGSGLVSLVYLGWILFRWYSIRATPPGWMTVMCIITMMGAVILFALGIACEYLLRILDEARKRPPFVVDEVIESVAARPKDFDQPHTP